MSTAAAIPFPYSGPPELLEPVTAALRRVVDPEVAMSIVDVGLVYGVEIGTDKALVTMTMTSPACPVTDLILDEVEAELDRVLPGAMSLETRLVWEPPWSTDRMSERAKRFMGW